MNVLDPLALSLACPECKRIREPFTTDGVLYDFCPKHGDMLVPIRHAADYLPAGVVDGTKREIATEPVIVVNPRKLAEWAALLQRAS